MSMDNCIGEPTSVLIRKNMFDDCRLGWSGDEGRFLITDYPTWLKLLSKGNMMYLAEPLSCFRQHKEQDTYSARFIMSVPVCYAIEIKYAWENMIFLTEDSEIKQCIINCMATICTSIQQLSNVDYKFYKRDYHILLRLMNTMVTALENNYRIDLSWLDTNVMEY